MTSSSAFLERACTALRQRLLAEARATMRFETPPGRQLQIDFGERRVPIGAATVRAYLFVATLGFSRRLHVRAFRHETQESWFSGIEGVVGLRQRVRAALPDPPVAAMPEPALPRPLAEYEAAIGGGW